MFFVEVIGNAIAFGAHGSEDDERAVSVALMGEKLEELIAGDETSPSSEAST